MSTYYITRSKLSINAIDKLLVILYYMGSYLYMWIKHVM